MPTAHSLTDENRMSFIRFVLLSLKNHNITQFITIPRFSIYSILISFIRAQEMKRGITLDCNTSKLSEIYEKTIFKFLVFEIWQI